MSEAGRAVERFFAQWQVYRLCIEHNTLHHRQVEAVLRREADSWPSGFRFLDLACGDAWTTSRVLAGKGCGFYRGVDFSNEALELARGNTAALGCGCEFSCGDLLEHLRSARGKFDVVYLGLSLHHFDGGAKREALRLIRAMLSDGGFFYLYEPILRSGEGRAKCLARWKENMDRTWSGFPAAAKDAVWEHVRSSDFPESENTWMAMASEAGFREPAKLFRDAGDFYSLMRFRA
jgi:SAM-dependent methyltransferase